MRAWGEPGAPAVDRDKSEMIHDFDVTEGYQRLVSRWHWVVVAGMIGGLVGLLASYVRPPIYQASAVIGIGIDLSRAEVPEDFTIRQAHDRVRSLLLADDILDQAVFLSAQRAGVAPPMESSAALRGRIRLAERPDGWELIVFGPSIAEAERLVQAWADASLEGIAVASFHALRAADWQHVLYEASCHLVAHGSGAASAQWQCESPPPEGDADAIPASILAEVEASRGILPAFSYFAVKGSGGSARPVVWGRESLVLGGAVVGFVIGVLMAASLKRSRPAGTAPLERTLP